MRFTFITILLILFLITIEVYRGICVFRCYERIKLINIVVGNIMLRQFHDI